MFTSTHAKKNEASHAVAASHDSKNRVATPVFIQPKLTVGSPDDPLEKEADDMADKVMRMPMSEAVSLSAGSNSISRKCAHCEEEEKNAQRKESSGSPVGEAPAVVHDVLNSSQGKSLDDNTRAFMEPRFGYDFSNVKIHDNDLAAKSASSINALAYTSGNNIVFNSGQFNSSSESGQRLLAHELTHVIQQNPGQINRMAVTPYGTPPASKCGSYSYMWKFELDKPAAEEGFMVQHVRIHETKKDCSEEAVNYSEIKPKDFFWECWHVMKGEKLSVDTIRDGWTDNFSESEKPSSSGTHADRGNIKFFPKSKTGDLNTLWTPNHYSGQLPASSSEPGWWNDAPIDTGYHFANSWWNCCGDAASQRHDSDWFPKK